MKQWRTMGDDRVRGYHNWIAKHNPKPIPVDKPYKVPAYHNAETGEFYPKAEFMHTPHSVNCRCHDEFSIQKKDPQLKLGDLKYVLDPMGILAKEIRRIVRGGK
jgi:hypothetical protein